MRWKKRSREHKVNESFISMCIDYQCVQSSGKCYGRFQDMEAGRLSCSYSWGRLSEEVALGCFKKKGR
jgi:hypothetical protein